MEKRLCDFEFGDDHDHDDMKCAEIMGLMNWTPEPIYMSGPSDTELRILNQGR